MQDDKQLRADEVHATAQVEAKRTADPRLMAVETMLVQQGQDLVETQRCVDDAVALQKLAGVEIDAQGRVIKVNTESIAKLLDISSELRRQAGVSVIAREEMHSQLMAFAVAAGVATGKSEAAVQAMHETTASGWPTVVSTGLGRMGGWAILIATLTAIVGYFGPALITAWQAGPTATTTITVPEPPPKQPQPVPK